MPCTRCGRLIAFMNQLFGLEPLDCMRCHQNGRLFAQGCRGKNCSRCRVVDSGWSEQGWP